MPSPFRFDRRFELAATPSELWAVLLQTDAYPQWWSWLRVLEGGELREGAVAHCIVRAPLPYTLDFEVAVQRVVRCELVTTSVSGDLEGPAQLAIEPRADGSTAHLSWALDLRGPFLRSLSIVTRPAMVWAHDRVVEMGLRDFERRALNGQRGAS